MAGSSSMIAHPTPPAGGRPTPGRAVPRRPAVRCLVATVLCVLVLAGCGLRLDTPPPEAPTPGPAEELRQETAASSARLAATVAALTERSEPQDGGPALERVAAEAEAHLDALGGVWEAWPDGAPEGATPPEPAATAPVADAAPGDVLELLTTGATQAREAALAAPDEDLAALLGSISLARARAAADLAAALDAPPAEPPAAPMSPETLLERGVDGPTVRVLDQARYAYETVAARTDGSSRESAESRVAQLQALVDTAIGAGAPDERAGVYGLPGADEEAGLSAQQSAVVDAETRLLEHWLFSLGRADAEVRGALLDAAADSAARVRAWGGSPPALPGLPEG
ncbi:DUF4439 domain-containing protein [Georgenia alba]|uniref:DUF4439 domain-containing protein n=1 Tax=Georgenia alba TaxID=2233858 RepID=A0ABW2Q9D9_9MICO